MTKKRPLREKRITTPEEKLKDIIPSLWSLLECNNLSNAFLDAFETERFDIDFGSGKTSDNFHAYFKPQEDNISELIGKYKQHDDPYIDAFTNVQYLLKNGHKPVQRLDQALAMALSRHASHLEKARPSEARKWEYLLRNVRKIADRVDPAIFQEGLGEKFEIIRASQLMSSHKLHRKIIMTSEAAATNNNPTVAELLVLASWMFDGLYQQRKKESELYALKVSPNHVVPTLVISCQPPAHARILYGYYDNDLKVGITELKNFDTPNYLDQMDDLLRWALAVPCSFATTSIPLPTIMESDEDFEVEVIETRPRPPTKSLWKTCLDLIKRFRLCA